MAIDVYEIADRYGVAYSGELVGPDYHENVDYSEGHWSLRDVRGMGGRITRVALLTENVMGARLVDVSYIHATLRDGRIVPVRVGVGNFQPLRGPRGLKVRFVEWAKREGVNGKMMGLLDEDAWRIL